MRNNCPKVLPIAAQLNESAPIEKECGSSPPGCTGRWPVDAGGSPASGARGEAAELSNWRSVPSARAWKLVLAGRQNQQASGL
jgi:hypothetical protein